MSIGQALQQARTDAGLSLDDVASRTRIRRTLVDRIEHDDFSLCGGDVYARGHVRTIAAVVGADPAPLLAEFDAERSSAAMSTPADAFDPEVRAAVAARRPPNWTAAMATVLVLVVALIVVQQVRDDGSGSTETSASSPLVEVTQEPTTAPKPTTKPTPRPTRTREPVARVPGTVDVQVAATGGASWLRVTGRDGRKLYEGILAKGQRRSFSDKDSVKLVLGNAGAVSLQVNGSPVGPPGDKGQVASLSFTPNDPA